MGPGTFSGYVVNLEFTFGFKSLEVDLKPNMFRGGLLSPTTPFMLAFKPPRNAEGPRSPPHPTPNATEWYSNIPPELKNHRMVFEYFNDTCAWTPNKIKGNSWA